MIIIKIIIQYSNMTVISGIRIDNIYYVENKVKSIIEKYTKEFSEKLNIIICISNPCQYTSRIILCKEFCQRIFREETNVNLFIVELAYNNDPFRVTNKDDRYHLQIRTNTPALWHKENLLNIGIQKLFPKDWTNVAWVDADIEFDNPHWASDTITLLKEYDIVQLFGHAVDMDANKNAMNIFPSFGYQYTHSRPYAKGGDPKNQWHPGFAYACSRKAYEQMGGLFQYGILGSGDHHMALSWIDKASMSFHNNVSDGYKRSIYRYKDKCKGLTLGYTPGVIRHHFHGSKKNRRYNERWEILVKHKYDPFTMVTTNDDGLLVPTTECPQGLLDDILIYFKQRNEDERLH
jgi:hypothetical protein